MSRPAVVTGAGAVTGLGGGNALWARYRDGERAARQVPSAFLDVLPEALRTRAARSERVTQLAFAAAAPALAGAGLTAGDAAVRTDVGIVLGTGFGCFLTNAAYQRRLLEGGVAAASPRLFAATVSNAAAGELGIAWRLGGPAVTLTAGAAAGLVALGHALDLLAARAATALLAGGVDALGDDLVAWLVDGGLDPGLPPGEAAALLVLERPDAARARGVPVLATLAGHAAGFAPPGQLETALAGTIAAALAAAGRDAAAVDVVVSPGVSGDAALARALRAVFGTRPPRVLAPKDAFGETFGAAGPLGLLAALAEVPRGAAVLALDACDSGHLAAVVAVAGAPA
jgi:3-oxoacyl-[acyl-carrier-protein] synthase II